MCLLLLMMISFLPSDVVAATVTEKFCALGKVSCSGGVITGATGDLGNV